MPQPTKRPGSARGSARPAAIPEAPALLRDYMDGAVDLVRELEGRYHNPPLLSLFRAAETRPGIRTAVLAAQDGAATLTAELDGRSGALDWTYRLSSMLGLRFSLGSLSHLDVERWLLLMREAESEPAFLWTARRWQADYLIGSAHRYYTNLFAFSPLHSEAAARLTPEAARKLFDWLHEGWFPPAPVASSMDW